MQQITMEELQKTLAENPNLLLVDVREEFEHEEFNIGGVLIPLSEIISRASEIPKDNPVVFYCRKGVRSQIAIQRLEARFGLANLINLQGGIEKRQVY